MKKYGRGASSPGAIAAAGVSASSGGDGLRMLSASPGAALVSLCRSDGPPMVRGSFWGLLCFPAAASPGKIRQGVAAAGGILVRVPAFRAAFPVRCCRPSLGVFSWDPFGVLSFVFSWGRSVRACWVCPGICSAFRAAVSPGADPSGVRCRRWVLPWVAAALGLHVVRWGRGCCCSCCRSDDGSMLPAFRLPV